MLSKRIEHTTLKPTWNELASAVEPFNESVAAEIREGNNKEEKQKVASSIQESASNDGDELNPSSPMPIAISSKGPQEEESEEEKEGKTTDNSAPEPIAVHASANNSEIRSRHSARNEQSPGESSQQQDKEIAGDHNPSHNESNIVCSYFYPLVFLCLISIVFLGRLYFFTKWSLICYIYY